MKTRDVFLIFFLLVSLTAWADTTINDTNKDAYGANIGWINCQGDVTNGAVIGEYVCSGYLYAANAGWIHLGDGSPADGIQYANDSDTDYGVNHDGFGNLDGLAYGANIGWIAFESQGDPKVNLSDGKLSGYAWSANCGWISLAGTIDAGGDFYVQTDFIESGADTDGDGITDAWEYGWAGNLDDFTATSDTDGDSKTDVEEHLADTNPYDVYDNLKLISFIRLGLTDLFDLTFTSNETRVYAVEASTDLLNWVDHGDSIFPPDPGLQTMKTVDTLGLPQRFFRVQAMKPLSP